MRALVVCLAIVALPPLARARTYRISPGVRLYLSCPRLHRQLDRDPGQVVAPVLIHFNAVPGRAELSRLSRGGVELLGRDAPLHLGPFFPARITRRGLQALSRSPRVRRVELSALRQEATPLSVTVPEIDAPAAWADETPGVPLTGAGVTIGSIDSGVDFFHPAYFRPDGGLYAWIDTDGDGAFTPGTDAVDLDGDGAADKGETLRLLDSRSWVRALSTKILSQGEGTYQPAEDWLYADANGNSERDVGPDGGFDDATPAFGEPLFVAEDLDGDGKLDPEEKLRRLQTPKVKAVWIKGDAYRLGQGMTALEIPATVTHGTGTTGIMVGGQRGFTARAGVAPGADLMLASTPYDGTVPVSAAIAWLVQSKVDVMLHEYAPWTGYHLDGSSSHEAMMDQAAQLGVAQITPAGNLGGAAKHARATLPAGGTLALEIKVPLPTKGAISELWLTLLWRDPSTDVAFTLTDPAGHSMVLAEDNTGGKLLGDGKTTVHSHREDSSRGTAMMDITIHAGSAAQPAPLAQGSWTLTAKHPGVAGSVQLLGYVQDDVSVWGSGAAFADHVSEAGLVCFPATADSAITVGAYTGHAGAPYDILKTGDPPGKLRDYSGRGERIDGAKIMDIAAPDNPLTPINSTWSLAAGPADYQLFGGTSGAGPHVAGAAALIKQLDPTLDGLAVRDRLRKGALADAQVGGVPSDSWGMGKLRVYRSLFDEDPVPNTPPRAAITTGPVHVGVPVTFTPHVTDAEDPEAALKIRWDEGYDDSWSGYGPVKALERTYDKPGWIRLKLEVRDSGGLTGAAAVLVQVASGPAVDGGAADGGARGEAGAAGDAGTAGDDGCGCGVGAEPRLPWLLLLLVAPLFLRRRRPE